MSYLPGFITAPDIETLRATVQEEFEKLALLLNNLPLDPLELAKPAAYALKPADTTRTDQDTLEDDPDLQFEAEADAVYRIELHLRHETDATGVNLDLRWNVPSGSCVTVGVQEASTQRQTLDSTNELGLAVGGQADTIITAHFHGVAIIGSTGGTFALEWAANVASPAADHTVNANSFLSWARIDI